MELGKKPLTKSRARMPAMPGVVRRAIATAFAFDLTPWKNGLFQKARSDMQSGCLATSRSERARPMPVYSWED